MIYFLVFILAVALSTPYLIDICSGYLGYQGFDLHTFLLWHYAPINNVIAHKDIFYPYGLLNYFKNFNLIYATAYYLVVPTLFIVTFFVFKKVFKDKFIMYSSFATFYLFILSLVGFQTFSRYGLLVVFSLYFVHTFYSLKRIKSNILIFLGIILGLISSFVIDQGIYLIFSFIFLYLLSRHFKIKEILYIVLGFFIGLIPLFITLLRIGSLDILLNYFNDVREIVTVAKTPFFSFIDSPANIFTIPIIYIAIFYNFIKIFLFKHKLTLSSLLQMSLIFSILIMEQKSIMRSIDAQITFASLMLLMLLSYEVINHWKNKIINKRIIYLSLIFSVIIIYSFNINKQPFNLSNIAKNYSLLVNDGCFSSNLTYFSSNNPSYTEIVNFLKNQTSFNGKVFSFPTGDSAFYVLLNQKPPFYNSIFGGSSYKKQKDTIKYVQENEIEFVTLNTDMSSVQDGVPDYIRQSLLFKYVLNNYYPFAAIGNHLILKKDKDIDFFSSSLLDKVKDYKNYLLNVNLKKIPYSEGLYKYKFLSSNNKLFIKTMESFSSADKVIVLIPSIDYKRDDLSYVRLKINGKDNLTIHYDPCKKNSECIINLSNIPMFYRERAITNVTLDKKFKGKIEIYNLKNPGNLW